MTESSEGHAKPDPVEIVPTVDRLLGKEKNLFDQPVLSGLVALVSEDFIGIDPIMAKACVVITSQSMVQAKEDQDPKQTSRKAARLVHGYMHKRNIELSSMQARHVTSSILQFLMQIDGLGEYVASQTKGAYTYTGELKNPEVHHVEEPTYKEWIARRRSAEKRRVETVGLSEVFRLKTNLSKKTADDVDDDHI